MRFLSLISRARVATLLVLALSAVALPAHAQGTGHIVGRVIEASSGTGLAGVTVQVVGTTIGTVTGVDGRYVIAGVRAGTVTLHARRLGFQAKTVTGLMLDEGRTLEQMIALPEATVQLSATVVTAARERGSVSAALDAQRNATGVVNAVTAEQIQRSPDSDAAQAVQRVSGVTVQDGRYVQVRGLGERYTTTSLNGARLPSPEPERKVVPLDLFPSGLLQSVTTTKNFTPDLPGDFSGATVDIKTREFPAERQVSLSLSTGINDAVTGRTMVAAPSLGLDWLGFAGGDRGLPASVGTAGLDAVLPQAEVRKLVGAFRNAWSPRASSAAPNASLGASVGGNAPVGGHDVGYVASLSYARAQEARLDERRAYADATGGGREIDRFDGRTGRASVLWGGIMNLSTMLGSRSRLSLNNTYNRTADSEARSESGFSENLGQRLLVDRLRFVERSVFSSQLAAQHQLSATHRTDWSLTASGVERNEPDRSEFVRVEQPDAAPFWLDASEAAVRTFGALAERSFAGSLDHAWQFGGTRHELKAGALARYTTREASNRVFSIQAPDMPLESRRRDPEQIFAEAAAGAGGATLRLVPLSQGGSYEASDAVGAGYAMVKLGLGARADVVGGARVERSRMEVIAEPTVGRAVRTQPTYTDVLPSLLVNLRLTDAQNLRVGASQTLARPEYRELAEVQYRDVIGAENVLGNPALKRTRIQNADLRWEWYPSADEVLSVGLFAKRFQDPIERIFLGTSGTRIVTFVNAERADNLGVELEARKHLGFLGAAFRPLTVFSNATIMRSTIEIDASTRAAEESRAMVGQAPYVVNAGVTWAATRTSATLLFNRVGRRIVSASERPLPSVYEEARDVLDLSVRFPLLRGVSGRLDAKNLLDAAYVQTQGPVVREHYRAGRIVSLGFSYQP
ncbi:MAG TPA: TonB-dependent receptor [Gemmatimonadaceae bacterium]|nr:TonB-dependent receptor [Gemmatimonadaceae bacterium]